MWPDEREERLRELWDEGLSSAAIGRELGVSKNAVVGKAHRMNLPDRPSPILPKGSGRPRGVSMRRPPPAPLPLLSSIVAQKPAIAPLEVAKRPPVIRPPRPPHDPVQPLPAGRIGQCAYVTSEGKPHRYCDDPTLPGNVYCRVHYELCIIRPRIRPYTGAAVVSAFQRDVAAVENRIPPDAVLFLIPEASP